MISGMKKRVQKSDTKRVDSIEKLAQLMADGFADVDARFEKFAQLMVEGFADVDARFDALEMRVGRIEIDIQEIKHILERIDTRVAALELAVFGATKSGGGKLSPHSMLGRIAKLERAVFRA